MEAEATHDAGLMYDKASISQITMQQHKGKESGHEVLGSKSTSHAYESYRREFMAEGAVEAGSFTEDPNELSDHICTWFDWILCSNQTELDGEQYYVLNRHSYYTKWLSEVLVEYSYAFRNDRKSNLKLESFGSTKYDRPKRSNKEEEEEPIYPLTAEQLFQDGWIAFFDVEVNECYWMQLATGRCERYLPIGDDYDNVVNLGLEFFDDDPQWVRPNQVKSILPVFIYPT